MASCSNLPQQQHVFAASPKTPCHPNSGYEVIEEPPDLNCDAEIGVLLSHKFDALADTGSLSKDMVHENERMPQDPDAPVHLCDKITETVKPKKKRRKSLDVSNTTPRRRSLRIQRRQSLGVEEENETSTIDNNNLCSDTIDERDDKQMDGNCQIKITFDGNAALTQTLEDVVTDLLKSASRTNKYEVSTKTNSDSDNIITSRKRNKAKAKSVLESLGPSDKENSLNDKITKDPSSSRKKRRDTFDLSKKRGLTRSGVVRNADDEIEQNGSTNFGGLKLQIDTKETDDRKVPTTADYESNETWTAMITPKNGSNEVQLSNEDIFGSETNAIRGSIAVKANLQQLTSIAIEEKMQSLFSEFSVYNYPCVSARIFAVMSIVYEEQTDFEPLLPFLQSLIKAEMVSLKSRTQSNDVYFINRKVCFSGFDYSATMPARDDIDGSHVDLNSSIEALEDVLRQAQFPRSAYYLDIAIQCLYEMSKSDNVSEACSKTIVGYFPSSRLVKAIHHYLVEFQDIKMPVDVNFDSGIRYRLGDFIGRSIRFNLRKMLNTIPEEVLDFDVSSCVERWGRAVDDWSISSILNFALEKVYDLITNNEQLFMQDTSLPIFFSSKTSEEVVTMPRKQIRSMPEKNFQELTNDLKEARSFLLGIRACRFVWELLSHEGVEGYINSLEGWCPIENVARSFYDLNIYDCSENKHFILLRNVSELLEIVGGPILNLEIEAEKTELYIKKLRKKLQPRKRESSFMVKGSNIYNLRMCLQAETEEHFPRCLTPPKATPS